MSDIHYPHVRILTPKPTPEHPSAESVFTRVEVDGQWWPIIDYHVSAGGSGGRQSVMLILHADVTIEHPADAD
jgi:hypothetical protein